MSNLDLDWAHHVEEWALSYKPDKVEIEPEWMTRNFVSAAYGLMALNPNFDVSTVPVACSHCQEPVTV